MTTPKEKLTKITSDLRNLVDVASAPGNYNVDPYMHGYANGLILAHHTASGGSDECPFLPTPARWLEPKYNELAAIDDTPPSASELIATEDSLIGGWMAEQAGEGKTTIDLTIVEHIRTGIRLALSA